MAEKKGAPAPQQDADQARQDAEKAMLDDRSEHLDSENVKYWKARGLTPPPNAKGKR